MPNKFAVVADHMFDGETMRRDCGVVIEEGRISGITDRKELPTRFPTRVMPPGAWLAPGFIDL